MKVREFYNRKDKYIRMDGKYSKDVIFYILVVVHLEI